METTIIQPHLSIFILYTAAYYLLHTTLRYLWCIGWSSMLDHRSVLGTANEQIETLQKKRMAKVLAVELCCGKLDQLSCSLLQFM